MSEELSNKMSVLIEKLNEFCVINSYEYSLKRHLRGIIIKINICDFKYHICYNGKIIFSVDAPKINKQTLDRLTLENRFIEQILCINNFLNELCSIYNNKQN